MKSDGTVATEPVDVAPGETITVRAQVKTPIQSDEGNKREAFVLKWDLIDTSTGKWLSQSGGPPTMDQEVIVEDPKSNLLGMEKYYQYVGKNTGAGSATMVNLVDGLAAASKVNATPTVRINGEDYEWTTPDALVAKIKEIVGDVPGLTAAPPAAQPTPLPAAPAQAPAP